jgi:hypothetical protein
MNELSTLSTAAPRANRTNGRPHTLDQRMAAQELVLAPDETAISYGDLVLMANAVGMLASRHLPTQAARIHLARCRRMLKPYIDEREDERRAIQTAHTPETANESLQEGDKVQFRDPLGMSRELADLDALLVAVVLPRRITTAMLPANDKAHPNNEDGLALALADLGPLYEIEDDDKE